MRKRKRSAALWEKDGNTVVNAVVDEAGIAEHLAASFKKEFANIKSS